MIAKGNQRGSGSQLATHLLNAHDNERVELVEVRGAVAQDIHGAFAEWRAQARATRCEKYLYSLSVNPDQSQGRMTRDQYLAYLDRVEKELGLQKQGRILIFHEKKDKDGVPREHCHCVWSRIDSMAGRAVQISHDRMKLRTVSREFAQELGRELPPGLAEDRGTARHEERKKEASLTEKQQEERTGVTKQQRQEEITAAWRKTKDGSGFAAALRDSGYILARGDRRGYIVVDRAGEIHSLARQVAGVKTAEIEARLSSSHPLASLPSADQALEQAKEQRQAIEPLRRPSVAKEMTTAERRAWLTALQQKRRLALDAERKTIQARHAGERKALTVAQQALRNGQESPYRTLGAFIRHVASRLHERQQDKALERRHKAELQEIVRQERNLKTLETRENRSLRTRLRRDDFQKLTQEIKQRDRPLELTAHIPIASRATDRQQEKEPVMDANERRSRLGKAFAARDTSSLPPKELERQSPGREDSLRGRFVPASDTPADNDNISAAERDAERLREEQRRLEQLRYDR